MDELFENSERREEIVLEIMQWINDRHIPPIGISVDSHMMLIDDLESIEAEFWQRFRAYRDEDDLTMALQSLVLAQHAKHAALFGQFMSARAEVEEGMDKQILYKEFLHRVTILHRVYLSVTMLKGSVDIISDWEIMSRLDEGLEPQIYGDLPESVDVDMDSLLVYPEHS